MAIFLCLSCNTWWFIWLFSYLCTHGRSEDAGHCAPYREVWRQRHHRRLTHRGTRTRVVSRTHPQDGKGASTTPALPAPDSFEYRLRLSPAQFFAALARGAHRPALPSHPRSIRRNRPSCSFSQSSSPTPHATSSRTSPFFSSSVPACYGSMRPKRVLPISTSSSWRA